MRLAARLLVFSLGLALGVSVAIPVYLESVAERLELAIERRLGVQVEAGTAEWDLSGRVVLGDVRVVAVDAAQDEADLFSVRRMELDVTPRWVSRKVRLESARLVGVDVAVVRREDGSLNISGALEAILKNGEESTTDTQSGGLSRFVERHVPSFTVEDIGLVVELGLGLPQGVPARVFFGKGRVEAENTALLKEENNLTIKASFRELSLSPDNRMDVSAVVDLNDAGDLPVDVTFQRPVELKIKKRRLLIGGVGWRDGLVRLHELALTEPLVDSEPGVVAPPLATIASIQTLSAAIDLERLTQLVTRDVGDLGQALMGVVSGVTLERPTLVFEENPHGHNLEDLVPLKKASDETAVEIPDHALGPLMKATRRAVAAFDSTKNDRSGKGVRGLLVRGSGILERGVREASSLIKKMSSLIPLAAVNIHEGTFAWRDAVIEAGGRADIAGRLENFNLVTRKTDDTITFDTSFLAPGTDRSSNRLKGSIQLVTGDIEIQAELSRMRLYPYRHVFPTSLPVAEDTLIRDTEVTLAWSPTSSVTRLTGKVIVDNATFFFRPLARDILTNIDVQVNFDGELDTVRKVIVLEKSDVRVGAVRSAIRGEITHYDTAPRMSGVVRLERSRCQDVVEAVPIQLIPLLEGLKVEGTLAWQVDFDLDTSDMDSLKYNSNPQLNQFRVVDMGKRLNLDAVRGTFLHRIQEGDGEVVELLIGPGLPNWAPLSGISPYVVKGVTTTEDGSFFRHEGFSPHHIKQSIVTNLKKGGFYRGASTITQQLVKNLFLTREKTISRKLQEFFITSQVETALGKERIMELYLNIIEFGPHLYGIKQAARHYFDKHPFDLSALESAFLVSLIPSPKRYYHQFSRGEVTDSWRRHLRWILKTMRDRKKISDFDYVSAAPYSPRFRSLEPEPEEGEEESGEGAPGADDPGSSANGQGPARRQTGPPSGSSAPGKTGDPTPTPALALPRAP
jgi:hypothetical protein